MGGAAEPVTEGVYTYMRTEGGGTVATTNAAQYACLLPAHAQSSTMLEVQCTIVRCASWAACVARLDRATTHGQQPLEQPVIPMRNCYKHAC